MTGRAASLLDAPQPALAIARGAAARWPELKGARLEPVKIRENAVFRATTPHGSYALRVHRPGYHSDDSLRSEAAWITALRAAGVATPRQLASASGSTFEAMSQAGVRHQVDLFEWIEPTRAGIGLGGRGVPLDEVIGTFAALGATMARIHNHSATWQPPVGFSRHVWDEQGLVGEAPLWGRFWELSLLTQGQRRLMRRVRDRLRFVLPTLPRDAACFGLVHADLMPENAIFAGEQLYVIDFDDAGFGWYLFDIAVSLFSFSARADFPAIRDSLIAGYRRHRALPDEALAQMPMFLAARGTMLLGWLHSRGEPESQARAPWLIELACGHAERWLAEPEAG